MFEESWIYVQKAIGRFEAKKLAIEELLEGIMIRCESYRSLASLSLFLHGTGPSLQLQTKRLDFQHLRCTLTTPNKAFPMYREHAQPVTKMAYRCES